MFIYFLIIWVVAFFALCLPLLFVTEKEKEEERNRPREMYEDIIFKNSKASFVVNSTTILNLIFLLILPSIIGIDSNFTNFQILYMYLIILIAGGIFIGEILIIFLLFMPMFPGKYLINLTFK